GFANFPLRLMHSHTKNFPGGVAVDPGERTGDRGVSPTNTAPPRTRPLRAPDSLLLKRAEGRPSGVAKTARGVPGAGPSPPPRRSSNAYEASVRPHRVGPPGRPRRAGPDVRQRRRRAVDPGLLDRGPQHRDVLRDLQQEPGHRADRLQPERRAPEPAP